MAALENIMCASFSASLLASKKARLSAAGRGGRQGPLGLAVNCWESVPRSIRRKTSTPWNFSAQETLEGMLRTS